MTYDQDGKLASVSDQFGRSLVFAYDPNTGFLSTLTAPGNQVYTYAYDLNNNLATLTFPDQTTKTYEYKSPVSNRLLTGIRDEDDNRFAAWTYDANGRAISSENAGANRMDLVYNPDGTTTITDPRGQARTYSYTVLHRVRKLTGVDQACDSCGSQVQTVTYDANVFVSSIIDFEGNQTDYTYNDRGLQTSRTEAVGTAQERTITTDYHPVFGLPTLITEPGRTTAKTYNDDGRLLTHTITDTTGLGHGSRTWTYTYNAQNLLETIDGPRTDLNDVTTYTYDGSGNLTSIQQPEGLTTLITAHDPHGRPASVTSPSGLVTDYTYDFRGNVLTQTESGRTTTYTYNDIGKLARIAWPGGGWLDFSYDNAHRLYQIQDSQGNRVAFTLDDLGNRTREDTFDPADVLKRTLARNFNQLNRLEALLDSLGRAYTYGYDSNGNLTSKTDPRTKTTTYDYDPLGRLERIVDALNGETVYGYDALDNPTSLQDADGNQTTYTFDGLGNMAQTVGPDTGTTGFTHDAAGNRLTRTAADAIVTTYTYDALTPDIS